MLPMIDFFQFAIEMIKLLHVMLFLHCANAIAYDASLTEQMPMLI
jgi:hypothetical protein